MSGRIKVLIVGDSGLVREVLKRILEKCPDIQVIGMAENGKAAIELTQKLTPDVITMDIHMPGMNGLEATEYIMAYCPKPILILSSALDKEGTYTTFDALAAGAVDVMEKPSLSSYDTWERVHDILIKKITLISKVKVITHVKGKIREIFKHTDTIPPSHPNKFEIIAIGASTGGPSVVMRILKTIPANYRLGILVVQHMAEGFIHGFVEWLGNACKVKVKVAKEGDTIEKGQVLVAPDGFHTIVTDKKTVQLISSEKVNSIKPSIDVLFDSIVKVYRKGAVGILLTGMGVDGANGLKHMKDSGGLTISQSEESCAVFGMPKAAQERGAVQRVLSVEEIIRTLNNLT